MSKNRSINRKSHKQPDSSRTEVSQQITRTGPAQLSPEIIQKFNQDNVDALVSNFTESIQ